MKKSHILLIAFLFGGTFPGLGCTTGSQPTNPPPVLPSAIPSPIPSPSPVPVIPTSTPLPAPPATLQPTLTLPAASTPTSLPFLPASLEVITPQNASELSRVAVLPEDGASVVAFSPDNRWMAAGIFRTNQIKIWDLASGQEQLILGGHVDPRIISYLAFSPDGSKLASAAQGWDALNDSLILWDASNGRELHRYNGVLGAVSPDWKLVALTQRESDQPVTLILSDLSSGKEIHTLQAPGDIYGVSFSPQGDQVAAKMYHVYQDLFSFWSVDSGRLDRTLYNWVGFSYSPDGKFIAALVETGSGSGKGELNIFDAATFKWIKTLAKEADALWYTFPAFSPDGQVVAASFGDHVTVWDVQTGKELVSLQVSGPAGEAFSPDGKLLTTYPQSGSVQLWGVE
jgi:WD40 repeat protein